MKIYKLKKDFPGSKIGDVWVKADNGFMSPEGRDTIKMHVHLFESFGDSFNDWFEDYKEPKGTALYWTILTLKNFIENEPDDRWVDLEDCKQMLEKLRACQRLKDKGFKVDLWDYDGGNYSEGIRTGRILFRVKDCEEKENDKDLDLLFCTGENR